MTFEQSDLNDDFVEGVVGIYNQSPVRRGKPFWHYGKDFATVKGELLRDLADSVFVAARYENELIGFIKFLVADRYAMVVLILDKMLHRDKAPMNGMIAKVVEICAEREIPYFTYTVWRRGDHGKFQESNGFERFPVPEYYVPLTVGGTLALQLGLHKGIKGAIPEPLMIRLLAWRAGGTHGEIWVNKDLPKPDFRGPASRWELWHNLVKIWHCGLGTPLSGATETARFQIFLQTQAWIRRETRGWRTELFEKADPWSDGASGDSKASRRQTILR